MSIQSCLETAVKTEEITREEADELLEAYDRLLAAKQATGDPDAAHAARDALAAQLEAENAHKRRQARLSILAIRNIDENLEAFRDHKGRADVAEAALAILEHNGPIQLNGLGFSSVAGRELAIVGMAHAKLENMLHHFRRGKVLGDKGRHNIADMDDLVEERFGFDTKNQPAKELAKAFGDVAEWLRQRFNQAGGAIPKLENWGLPQFHDRIALMRGGYTKWRDFIRDRLDVSRMRHPLTGDALNPDDLEDVLKSVYQRIVTDGWIDKEPARSVKGRGALGNQHAEHRVLVFKNPQLWLEYQREFGRDDVFASMMGHINMIAKDIAAMEILGPNPDATIEYIKQKVKKEAELAQAGMSDKIPGTQKKALDKSRRMHKRIDEVWASMRGSLNSPIGTTMANVASGVRNLLSSSLLGSAAISAISDAGMTRAAKIFAGLPADHNIKKIIESFGTMTRREAVQAGLILDSAQHVLRTQARYVGALDGPEWTQYVADRVLTYSLLTPWTQAAKHAWGLSFQNFLALSRDKGFAELPEYLRRTMDRYGLGVNDWDRIRSAPRYTTSNGLELLRPTDVAKDGDERLAERYLEMILMDQEYAVPTGGNRARTLFLSDTQPGTLHGELLRSGAQFKNFGITYAMLHGLRAHRAITSVDKGYRERGMTYAGTLLWTSVMYGAIAHQLKQIAGGRDPAPMDSAAFWGQALLQGGGLGIYGDFLFADVNRYGGGFAQTAAGPSLGKLNDFWNLTAGNMIQLATGDKTHFGREFVNFLRGTVPSSNIWYARQVWERGLFDQLQYLVDPEASKAFRRREQYWQRERGQEFYWKPGKFRPDRLPDIGVAF